MDPRLRVVTQIPLQELWRIDGPVFGPREKWLSVDEIRELLREGAVEFVIADTGLPLKWVSLSDCHEFWKTEVRPHFADPHAVARIEDFPNGYFYSPSQWREPNSATSIVLLERHH
jgi:hypothetical protein